MVKLCPRVLDGKGNPDEKTDNLWWSRRKGDGMNCGPLRGIKLLEHAMKIVKRILEKRLRDIVNLDELQFGLAPGKGTVDALRVKKNERSLSREGEKLVHVFCERF